MNLINNVRMICIIQTHIQDIYKFEFVGIKAVPFGEGGGAAVGRGSDLYLSVYLIYRLVCSPLL